VIEFVRFRGPLVTVVVVSYRTPNLARDCIESFASSVDVPAQACIVDTSGGEGAIGTAEAPPNVPVYYLDHVGYGAALNYGFEDADSPFLLACNADVKFPKDGIAPLLELFDENPSLGLLGPRQVSPDGKIVHAGIEKAGDPNGGRGYGEPDDGRFRERLLDVEQISGSVMLMRRNVFEAVGGMPPVKLYYEDALLSLKVRRSGYRVAFSGVRTFLHHVAASPPPPEGRAALARESQRAFIDYLART
jgi:GT2 family glycosyltransferase